MALKMSTMNISWG